MLKPNHNLLRWLFFAGCCIWSMYANAQGTCSATPVLTINSTNTLCDQTPLNLSVTVVLPSGCMFDNDPYRWGSSNGSLSTNTATGNTTLSSAGVGDYWVEVAMVQDPTSPYTCPCTLTSASNIITVSSLPTAPSVTAGGVSGTVFTICNGSNLTFTANSTNGTTGVFKWYDAGGQLLFVGNPYISAPYTASTNLAVVEEVNGCAGTPTNLNVTVDNTIGATPPVAADASICAGTTATLQATIVNGESYAWYSDAALTNLVGQGATYITLPLTANATYYVVAQRGQCISNPEAVDVTVTALVPPTVPATVSICVGNTATITATSTDSNVNFNWYSSNTPNATPIFTSSVFTTPRLFIGTSYYVSAIREGCESALVQVVVNTNAAVALPTVTNQTICAGQTATFTVTNGNAGDVFYWYDAATNGNVIATGSQYTTLSLTATKSYWVTRLTNSGFCKSARTPVTATVNALSAAPTTVGTTICPNNRATMTATTTTTGASIRLKWYDVATGGAVLQTGGSYTTPNPLNQTTIFYVETNNVSTGCRSTRTPVEATVST